MFEGPLLSRQLQHAASVGSCVAEPKGRDRVYGVSTPFGLVFWTAGSRCVAEDLQMLIAHDWFDTFMRQKAA